MVAPDSNEPEITTQQGASTMNMTSIHVERNIEEPDLEVLSVPQRDDNTGITGGQYRRSGFFLHNRGRSFPERRHPCLELYHLCAVQEKGIWKLL